MNYPETTALFGHADGHRQPRPATTQTCGEALVRLLEDYGVELVFGIPGVHTVELYRGLAASTLRHVTPRHEQGAGFMADGYARVTGKPGVCFIITGPGMTNIATAMAQAYADSIPMLVVSSVNATRQLGSGAGRLHELPSQHGVFAGLTAFSHTLLHADELPQVLARAFAVFASERPRPVHIEIPLDVIVAPARGMTSGTAVLPAKSGGAPAALDEAATLLAGARRPIILAGGGAIEAAPELRALAERLQAPVALTINAKGLLPRGHALSIGSTQSLPATRAMVCEADVVLAVGTRMFIPFTAWGTDDKLKIIKVDIDAAEHDRWAVPVTPLTGDAAAILRRLDAHLAHRAPMDKARVAASRALNEHIADDFAALGVMRDYLQAIRDVLPDDGVLVDELTQVGYAARVAYEARGPRTYISSGYQGTLGWGLATALGAKHALGPTPVVSLCGDGGFMFNVQELSTAVRHRIPLVVVLFNDGAYGNVRNMQRHDHGNRVIATDLANPDFMRLAASFGIGGYRASDPGGLRVALERALAQDEPALIEVPCGTLPDPWRFIDMPKVRGV